MQHFLIITTSLAALSTLPAAAQDTSFQISGALGAWHNQYGGNGFDARRGIEGTYDRGAAELSFSIAAAMDNGLTTVATAHFGYISPAEDGSVEEDDATKSTADLTLRVMTERGNLTFGSFAGGGTQDDYGDSDIRMTYGYVGGEVVKNIAAGTVYAQIGYLNSEDEFKEGPADAPFLNIGGSYNIAEHYALTGAFSYARGDTLDLSDNNELLSLTVGVERSFGDYVVRLDYEATQISFESVSGATFGDTFGTLSVGASYRFGGTAQHGSLLPKLARWVAYSANEIEQPLDAPL
ncbi:hypothetical protein ACJ5NV_04850 [Loktanella agnita]|uniref:hypothetical protein n=1 Tax=Loktanella agnita TaxID=287097 RepID=UPI003986BCF7